MATKRVAVVGSSGLVGARLVERLRERADMEVRPLIHSSGNAWRLARLGVSLTPVNLLDESDVLAALAGCTHVVNCSRGTDDVMIRGLRNLLRASRRSSVGGFIHLSSVMVYGDPPPPEAASEAARTPRHPKGSYPHIKSLQDQMVQRHAKEGLPSLILCPPNISGPYSYFLLNVLDSIRSRRFALLNEGHSPCVLVDVDNLCHAIELAMDSVSHEAHRLFITDNEETTWRQVVDAMTPLFGSPLQIRSISREALELARRESAPPRASVLRTLKHLMSSNVREALRQDPLLARVDRVLRRSVARMGESIENRLRLTIEGPLRVPTAPRDLPMNVVLCAQQLRNVRHSPSEAERRIGYRPVETFLGSMERFKRWYRESHHMDSEYWDLFSRLYS